MDVGEFFIRSEPCPVPVPSESQVWLDFDGTISQMDVLDELIKRFAVNDEWKVAERCWQDGKIGSKQCLEAQFSSVRINPEELVKFLDTIGLDPGITPLLHLLRSHHVPVAILSDGIDHFINRLLKRHGITLPVRSNTISHDGDELTMSCPHNKLECESAAAHCKCASKNLMSHDNRKHIYVGDGRSDLCAARKCEIVFAKGTLSAALSRENQAHFVFQTLDDVVEVLQENWRVQLGVEEVRSLRAS